LWIGKEDVCVACAGGWPCAWAWLEEDDGGACACEVREPALALAAVPAPDVELPPVLGPTPAPEPEPAEPTTAARDDAPGLVGDWDCDASDLARLRLRVGGGGECE
jgi:hypothetical protein